MVWRKYVILVHMRKNLIEVVPKKVPAEALPIWNVSEAISLLSFSPSLYHQADKLAASVHQKLRSVLSLL